MLDLIAYSNSPLDFFPHPAYKSGLESDVENLYADKMPSIENPVLVLPYVLYSESKDALMPGYYELALSSDKKFLLLIESKRLRAKIPVFKLVEDKKLDDKELAEDNIEKVKKQDTKRRYKAKPVRKPDNYFELRKNLNSSAKISDSGLSYYILEYKSGSIAAYAYILK